MRPFAVGCYLPQNVSPELVFAWARAAESAGLAELWVPDHLHQFPDKREGRLEAWTLVGALAAETATIRLGIGVCNVQLRNPALLAKMAFTVDRLSGGRLMLGLGTGGNAAEMLAYGITPPSGPAGRRRLADTLRIIRALESGGPCDTPPGSTEPLHAAYCCPTPVQRPLPLAVAGDHPDTLRIAARDADCWYANLYRVDRFAEQNRTLDPLVAQAGRPRTAVDRLAHVLAIAGRTAEEARQAAAAYARRPRAALFATPHLIGDADLLRRGLAAYRDAGATRAAVYLLNLPWCGREAGAQLIEVLAGAAAGLTAAGRA